MERSKALQTENTTLRMDRDRAASDLARTKAELREKATEAERQSGLVAQLEEHVEKLQELSNRGEAEGRSSADILVDIALDNDNAVGEDAFASTSGSTTSPARSPDSSTTTAAATTAEATFNSKAALLPIVQAQRERFKRRNEELEEDSSRMSQQIELLQGEVRDLRGDNVKLYEKIRFLQGFQVSGAGCWVRLWSDFTCTMLASHPGRSRGPFVSLRFRRVHPGGGPVPDAVRAEDGPLLFLLTPGEAEEIRAAQRLRKNHLVFRAGGVGGGVGEEERHWRQRFPCLSPSSS